MVAPTDRRDDRMYVYTVRSSRRSSRRSPRRSHRVNIHATGRAIDRGDRSHRVNTPLVALRSRQQPQTERWTGTPSHSSPLSSPLFLLLYHGSLPSLRIQELCLFRRSAVSCLHAAGLGEARPLKAIWCSRAMLQT